MNPLFEEILNYRDAEADIAVAEAESSDETLAVHFVHDGDVVGVAEFRLVDGVFEWQRVAMGAWANRGIVHRFANWIHPQMVQYGVKQAIVRPFSAAETLTQRHGYTEDKRDLGLVSLDPKKWREPTGYERWQPPSME